MSGVFLLLQQAREFGLQVDLASSLIFLAHLRRLSRDFCRSQWRL